MIINSEHEKVVIQALTHRAEALDAELAKRRQGVVETEAMLAETKAVLNSLLAGGSALEPGESKKQPIAIEDKAIVLKISEAAPQGWEADWTWEVKIKRLLEDAGKALSTTEMADTILSYEPWRDRAKIVASISAVLSQKSREGGVFSKKEDLRGNYLYAISNSAVDDFHNIINNSTSDEQ